MQIPASDAACIFSDNKTKLIDKRVVFDFSSVSHCARLDYKQEVKDQC